MATVNFGVPDDVRDVFNETFKDRNKSSIIADLMREAVDRYRQREQSNRAIRRILERRRGRRAASDDDLRSARHAGRP